MNTTGIAAKLGAEADSITRTHPIVVSKGTKFDDGSDSPADFRAAWIQKFSFLEEELNQGRFGSEYAASLTAKMLETAELGPTILAVEGLTFRPKIEHNEILERLVLRIEWYQYGCGDGVSNCLKYQNEDCGDCNYCSIRQLGQRHGAMLIEQEEWSVSVYFPIEQSSAQQILDALENLTRVKTDAELRDRIMDRRAAPWDIFLKRGLEFDLGSRYSEARCEVERLEKGLELEGLRKIAAGEALEPGSLAMGSLPREVERAEKWTEINQRADRSRQLLKWGAQHSDQETQSLVEQKLQVAFDERAAMVDECMHLIAMWQKSTDFRIGVLKSRQREVQDERHFASYPGLAETRPKRWER